MTPTAKAFPRAVPRNGIKRAVRTDTNIVKNSCNMQLVLPVKKGKAPTEFSSGQTGFSPDGKTFLAICENTYSSGTPSLYVFPAATHGGLFAFPHYSSTKYAGRR